MSAHINKDNGKIGLVFGISGDQGQSVAIGLMATKSYRKVFGVTSDVSKDHADFIAKKTGFDVNVEDLRHNDTIFGTTSANHDNILANSISLLHTDLSNPSSLQTIFQYTRATHIFLVTTTDIPLPEAAVASFHESEEQEYQTIVQFFNTLLKVHQLEWNDDGNADREKLHRHIVYSTLDNVRELVEWLEIHEEEIPNGGHNILNMKPLDDGGIVPHYTGKGRGGEYALSLIHGLPSPWAKSPSDKLHLNKSTSSIIPGLSLTLITLPFLYSNFTACAIPLPTTSLPERRITQWSISACLGDPLHPLDMFSVTDLQYVVPVLFQNHEKYQGRNVRLSSEKITMDEVAYLFADLFGKNVVYSPMTVEEMSALDIPGAAALAQMFHYLGSYYANRGDVEETREIMLECGKKEPQKFQDWLLTHSDHISFERAQLTMEVEPIQCVTVFNATCMQGKSVIKGLLADSRKKYTIRACICAGSDTNNFDFIDDSTMKAEVQSLQTIAPDRITIHSVDVDDPSSYAKGLEGSDGVFVVTDFYCGESPMSQSQELQKEEEVEQYARHVIDACASSGTVKHIVLSTLELAEEVDKELKDVDDWVVLNGHDEDVRSSSNPFDVKARLAAYAQTKSISVTFILMPLYTEDFFHALALKMSTDDIIMEENEEESSKDEEKSVVCMSVDELGPAVANIFDSYEVFAGHEISLMTDILSLKEATSIIKEVFFESTPAKASLTECGSLEPSIAVIDATTEPEIKCKVDTFAKDLGQIFRYLSKAEAVKKRLLVAKTMALVPDAKPFRQWLEENRDNVAFREMLGIR